MNNQAAEILALLDVRFDPEPGRRYPTIDQYTEALAQIRRDDARRARASVKPTPKPHVSKTDLLEKVIAAPAPARVVAIDHQVPKAPLRFNVTDDSGITNKAGYIGRGGVVYLQPPPQVEPPHSPGLRLSIRTPMGWAPIEGQSYPIHQRDLAEGALSLFRARQPGVEFAIIAE